MADILISQLPAGTPLLTDLLILANPTTGIAKKSTVTQLNSVLTLAKLSDVSQITPPANSILEWDGSFSYITNVVRSSGASVGFVPTFSATSPVELTPSILKETSYGFEISEDTYINNASVIFGLSSNSKGFVMPKMISTDRTGISSPLKGLEVFDTTLNIPYFYNGTAWKGVQEVLVSATNIKTINGSTILGSGDLIVGGGITTLNTLTASTQTFAVGSTGTDFTISSATSTHTFNLPTASATNRGLLSSANWTTFNNKVGGSGTANYLAKFTASGTIGNSLIFDNGTFVGVNTATNIFTGALLQVKGSGYFENNIILENTSTECYLTFGSTNTLERLKIGYRQGFYAIVNNSYANIIVDDIGNVNYLSGNGASGHKFYSKFNSASNTFEAMRVTNDGKLWINRTTDDGTGAKLQVNGSIKVTDIDDYFINLGDEVGLLKKLYNPPFIAFRNDRDIIFANSTNGVISINNSYDKVFTIKSSTHNVIIGTNPTTDTSRKLQLYGEQEWITPISTGSHTTSGNHLPIWVNGVKYWLALLNPVV